MRISDWSSDVCSSDLAVTKRKAPDVEPVDDLEWPDVERTKLSNGVEVVFARRATVPTVRLSMSFDAGYADDDKAKLGTHAMMLALMDEGTRHRTSEERGLGNGCVSTWRYRGEASQKNKK